jgi:hypothetical protein
VCDGALLRYPGFRSLPNLDPSSHFSVPFLPLSARPSICHQYLNGGQLDHPQLTAAERAITAPTLHLELDCELAPPKPFHATWLLRHIRDVR